MLEKKFLNLKIGLALQEALQKKCVESGLSDPLPGIIWGRWDDENIDTYSIGIYERSNLPYDDPVRIVDANGIEILIIQDWVCDDLTGKVLDISNGKLVAQEQR
jgi:hypothetical protein